MKDMAGYFHKQTTTGKIIKSFRKNFNITQKEIADIIGINESNMSAIENDRREIGVDLATRLGAFLGIHPSILLFPNGQEEAIHKYRNILNEAKKLIQIKLKKVSLA
ncbi:MAG: helix-turn-helix transcriptional regulator [Pseudomonadota bacterium]